MNRRQIINKILHDHIDVNKCEDYTNYKKLITAIEEWHESEVKKLPIHIVSQQRELLLAYEEYTSYKVLGKKTDRISKQMVEDFLANNCG